VVIQGARGRVEASNQQNVISYDVVMIAREKFGVMENVAEWLSKAQEARLKPNVITYSAIIGACAKSGDMEKVAEWLSKAHEAGRKPNVTNARAISKHNGFHWVSSLQGQMLLNGSIQREYTEQAREHSAMASVTFAEHTIAVEDRRQSRCTW